ncbi:DUF3320 domain-containing protein [Thalassotalea ponticola]|uniref:DUF3320 domain-containing protein n=1 Tax=Thalassotalea ponticola TaxID=1523392 RepID=UPI0025B61C82|nr:DUF3320 domain-containing protein [Thalassotalea ponticola]MDN3652199.1 DUF3320 domain-containing protein [Thalassotalea ponticola]
MSQIALLLEDLRKRLVATGTRNRLIHVNRQSQRARLLNIINNTSDRVFSRLKIDGKTMRFVSATGTTDQCEQPANTTEAQDKQLVADINEQALGKTLVKIANNARIAEQERGINILFLALGFLRWFEDERSDTMRQAPLILLPVQLVRKQGTVFELRVRDEDLATNLPLQERLKADFAIALPDIDDVDQPLPSTYFAKVRQAISTMPRWSVDDNGMQLGFFSFAKLLMLRDLEPQNWPVTDLTKNRLINSLLADGFVQQPPLWSETDNIDQHLSSKNTHYVVDADTSQANVIEQVNQGRDLLVQGPPGTGKSQTITNILAGAALQGKKVLFVAEKMAALEVVERRLNRVGLSDLYLQLHSHKANKKAFLTQLALTLSHADKQLDYADVDPQLTELRDQLNEICTALHNPLPSRDYSPYKVLSQLSSFMAKQVGVPVLAEPKLERLSDDDTKEITNSLANYLQAKASYGTYQQHVFYGVTNVDIQPFELAAISAQIEALNGAYERWTAYRDSLSQYFFSAQEDPQTEQTNSTKHRLPLSFEQVSQWQSAYQYLRQSPQLSETMWHTLLTLNNNAEFSEALATAKDWLQCAEQHQQAVKQTMWDVDLDDIRLGILDGVHSWFRRTFFSRYKNASEQLQKHLIHTLNSEPEKRLALIEQLIEAKLKKQKYEQVVPHLEQQLSTFWQAEHTDVKAIERALHWLENAPEILFNLAHTQLAKLIAKPVNSAGDKDNYQQIEAQLTRQLNSLQQRLGFADAQPTDTAVARLLKIQVNINQYSQWVEYYQCRKALLEYPIEVFIHAHDQGQLSDSQLPTTIDYAMWIAKWNRCRSSVANLDAIAKVDRDALVASFNAVEKSKIIQSRQHILQQHLDKLPKGALGEMGLIRGQFAKKRGHKPIRYLMSHAGETIQAIKPIFLMSPISVAQYLPPEQISFDLLVIDEASQIRPEDALGCIARARQIVVVGDQKQLPPTSFFDRLTDNIDADEDEPSALVNAVEMESILSLGEARGMTQTMLKWHYRSKDPSLIAVSNTEFYHQQLIFPPCPTENDAFYGLSLTRVPGEYSSQSQGSGKPGTNRVEAEHIADQLLQLAQQHPQYSVGVVTFSKAQADMVDDVLEQRRLNNPLLDAYLREDKVENVFVKNIENVQGDERDIILISVGYGPFEANGRLASMNFGPINSDGGERRLNVLFTRARLACRVVCSFEPTQIDLSRTSKSGPKVLKTYLQFAQQNSVNAAPETKPHCTEPLINDIAKIITALGYEVEHQVGQSAFKLELAVKQPQQSRYLMAIETDGQWYRFARSARERDCHRQSVLQAFGWHYHRIWCTDWFYRRDKQITRLSEALKQAEQTVNGGLLAGKNVNTPTINRVGEVVELDDIDVSAADVSFALYQKADFHIRKDIEPHLHSVANIADILVDIIDIEGPVHLDELTRRYATLHGKARSGSRITAAVTKGIDLLLQRHQHQLKQYFIGTNEQFNSPPIRDRSTQDPPINQIEFICDEEIFACWQLFQSKNKNAPVKDIEQAIAKAFGFKRLTAELSERITRAVKASR